MSGVLGKVGPSPGWPVGGASVLAPAPEEVLPQPRLASRDALRNASVGMGRLLMLFALRIVNTPKPKQFWLRSQLSEPNESTTSPLSAPRCRTRWGRSSERIVGDSLHPNPSDSPLCWLRSHARPSRPTQRKDPMKKHLVIGIIGCSFLLSGCLVVGPRGKRRQGVHSHKCHASEYWDGHKLSLIHI